MKEKQKVFHSKKAKFYVKERMAQIISCQRWPVNSSSKIPLLKSFFNLFLKTIACFQAIFIFVFSKSRLQNLCVMSSWTLLHISSYNFHCFFRILSSININSGHILVQHMTNISNLFSVVFWSLENSSWHFSDFEKLAICNLLIFCKWRSRFLIVSFHTFNRA